MCAACNGERGQADSHALWWEWECMGVGSSNFCFMKELMRRYVGGEGLGDDW